MARRPPAIRSDPFAVRGMLWSLCEDVGMRETTESGAPAGQRLAGGRPADLFPGYFALVMATGIIAVGALQQNLRWLAWALLWVNVAFYVVLWVLYLLRLARDRARFLDELTSHQRGPSFLTMVAGTNVLGAGFILIAGWRPVGIVLWFIGIALWVVLFYTVMASLTLREPKPDLAAGLNGGGCCWWWARSPSVCWAPCSPAAQAAPTSCCLWPSWRAWSGSCLRGRHRPGVLPLVVLLHGLRPGHPDLLDQHGRAGHQHARQAPAARRGPDPRRRAARDQEASPGIIG